ncbi:phage tail tape measure protein [[Clostridium] sordellii]|uniref:phage tail tape measure protein n=1 Tax=Paraclostridium sordellii TaxID=1505 RepID=UPI0005E7D006|nr:phage tail tape measure protein [Paeniclostridium sordellii]CEP46418.1 phage tail tape measure protein [[Clostridium] sordellii] [Paeniclostridium sordellii]
MSVNLGTATAYIDLDSSRFTSGLLKASKSLDATSREFRKNESEFNRLGTSINGNVGYFKKLDLASKSLGNQLKASQNTAKTYKTAIDDTSQAVKKAQSEHSVLGQKMTVLQSHLQRSNQMYGEGSKQSKMYSKAISDIGQQQNKLESEIEKGNIAIEEFGIAMQGAETQATGLQKELKNFKLKQIGQDMTQLGKTLTTTVTGPLVGLGTASIATAAKFEAGMSEVKAITGATGNEFKKLENQAKELGSSTKFSASEAALGMKYFGMAGFDTNQILNAMPATLDLAAAGNTDLALTCDIVSDGLTAMGMNANETGKFADIMAATITAANTDITMMGETLKYVGPVAGTLGISMEDLSLAIGLMGSQGIKSSQAGTALRGGLTRLVKPTDEAAAMMERYGIELKKTDTGSVDFMETIKNLRSKLGDLDETTQASVLSTIFGKEAMSGWAAVANTSEKDFNKISEAIANSSGKAHEMAEIMQDNLWGALTNLKSALEGAAIGIGDALLPVIKTLTEWLQKALDWFNGLSDGTKTTIATMGLLIAAIGPVIMIVGSLITSVTTISGALGSLGGMFGLTSGAAAGTRGAMAGASGAAAGLAGILGPMLGVALLGIIAKIGDNENALLKLQEKFGGLGTVIGGVCEFISGVVQLTFGNLAIAIMGVFDIIAAIIDGPGGATVNDAVDKMTAKMKLNTEEAMGKMVLTTTRGMSQMRNATDEQLNGTVESMNTIMDAIPRIVDGKYRTASQALGQQLHNMDFTQLSILQGMNDTTKMIFQGIVEGMSVEQASKKVEQNLKEMAAAGKIDADTMQKDISQAMEHMKQQMDAKTKEGADKVNANTKNAEIQAVQNAQNTKDGVSKAYSETTSNIDKSTKEAGNKAKTNMDQASKDVGNATNNMANEAKKGTSKLASNTDADMKNANKAVQQSATDMYNGAKKSYSKLADVAKQEASRMHNGVRDSASAMSLKARQSASEMYRGVTTSTRLMANAAIADWNRIRSVYSQPIHGTVTKTTVLQTISQGPKSINEKLTDISTFYKQKVHNFVNPEDNNINMKAYDIVKSNDIASYITSRISNYLDEKNKIDSEKENNKRTSNKKTQDINLFLNIEKFENRTDNDIEQLMEEIGFVIKRKINLA